MSANAWIAIVSFLVVQAFAGGILIGSLRQRVSTLEETTRDLVRSFALLVESSAKAEAVQREDEKILEEIEKLDREIKEGFVYFGKCLGNLTQLVNAHESWLSAMEQRVQGAAGSRPRMNAIMQATPPGWLPPPGHVPPPNAPPSSSSIATGQHRSVDPRREK
jgi:hypothetical protein